MVKLKANMLGMYGRDNLIFTLCDKNKMESQTHILECEAY